MWWRRTKRSIQGPSRSMRFRSPQVWTSRTGWWFQDSCSEWSPPQCPGGCLGPVIEVRSGHLGHPPHTDRTISERARPSFEHATLAVAQLVSCRGSARRSRPRAPRQGRAAEFASWSSGEIQSKELENGKSLQRRREQRWERGLHRLVALVVHKQEAGDEESRAMLTDGSLWATA